MDTADTAEHLYAILVQRPFIEPNSHDIVLYHTAYSLLMQQYSCINIYDG